MLGAPALSPAPAASCQEARDGRHTGPGEQEAASSSWVPGPLASVVWAKPLGHREADRLRAVDAEVERITQAPQDVGGPLKQRVTELFPLSLGSS